MTVPLRTDAVQLLKLEYLTSQESAATALRCDENYYILLKKRIFKMG